MTFALLALAACAAPPPPVAPAPPVVAAAPPPPPPPSPELPSVGSLERPGALARFFEALARLEAGNADDDVRITQFGDSHTAADWETGPARRALQARFGDGGRGFVPIGLPWKAWSQEGVLAGMAGEWMTAMTSVGARTSGRDGVFGLSGFALATRRGGSRAWLHILTAASRAEMGYLEQPSGGSFELVVDGARIARVSTRSEEPRSAFRPIELAEAPRHHVEVHAVGDGEVRLFGLSLDRAEHGIVYDALGINGARMSTALSWSEAHWAEQVRHRAPHLVIVAYGTNEAADVETSPDAFESDVADALARIGRAAPSASCLVLGPPDRAAPTKGTPPRVVEIVARERRVAEKAGCAFYDRMAALGGPGSMSRWGQKDGVHLSREGYSAAATAFVSDLLGAYDLWAKSRR